jgi:4,5-DOPA dioxygenase extradiol
MVTSAILCEALYHCLSILTFDFERKRIQFCINGCPRSARIHVESVQVSATHSILSHMKYHRRIEYPAGLDENWGLDHGTWAVLRHVFPDADIPIVQLSIDERQPPSFHYEIGKILAPLREEGVLVIGSGNIVHNLHTYAWGNQKAHPFDWAVRFEEHARKLLLKGDDTQLIAYERLGHDAMLSIPTPDHYLPLLYVLGLRKKNERVSFPVNGVDGGSVSMLAIQIG